MPSTFRISFVSHHNVLGMCSHPQVPDGKTKEGAGRWWAEAQPSLGPPSWELRSPSALPSLVSWLSHRQACGWLRKEVTRAKFLTEALVFSQNPPLRPQRVHEQDYTWVTCQWRELQPPVAPGPQEGWQGAARGSSDQAWDADQNTHLHCKSHARSCRTHVCGVRPQLLPWASQGLCRVLLEPISWPEGQLAFLPDNASLSVAPANFTTWKIHLSEHTVLLPSFRLPTQPTWDLTLWSLSTPFARFIFSFEHACWCFSVCWVIYGLISPRECQLHEGRELFCSRLGP